MEMICLGDSLTFGYGVHRSQCWVTLLGQALGCETVNLGVPGDTTAGMLARLSPQVMPRLAGRGYRDKPPVLVMGGGNDIFYAGTDTGARANLGAIVHQLLSAGVRVTVLAPPGVSLASLDPQWKDMVHPGDMETLARYCGWMETFCRVFGVPFIDLRPVLAGTDGLPRPELYLEGLHPTAQGHRLLADSIFAALPAALKAQVKG